MIGRPARKDIRCGSLTSSREHVLWVGFETRSRVYVERQKWGDSVEKLFDVGLCQVFGRLIPVVDFVMKIVT